MVFLLRICSLSDVLLMRQACMTAPMEILASVDGMGAITNARVSGDGGISVSAAAMGSLLTSIVGIGWSKDNIKTRTVSAGDPPCCRMGVESCEQFCNSSPGGFQELQMMLATLSLGKFIQLATPTRFLALEMGHLS